jgi:hypothetical protein
MKQLGDITKLDGGMIPPVHVITFGSPCQNLSAIGNREGLAGRKSGLFYQAVRIIQEMREATDGLYPVITVWENVPGAFSSNDRMDFRAVLESLAGSPVPMPPSGQWANAGMVRGRKALIGWRLMDARYWGSPALVQRRKRIFKKELKDLQGFLTGNLQALNTDTVRADVPVSSEVTNVQIWEVAQKDEHTYSVTYTVDQRITENGSGKTVQSAYEVAVHVDDAENLVITKNPTITRIPLYPLPDRHRKGAVLLRKRRYTETGRQELQIFRAGRSSL